MLAQVYDGTILNAREEQAGNPVNAYGRSKLEAEQVIQVRGDVFPATLRMHQDHPLIMASPTLSIPTLQACLHETTQ